MSGGRGLPLLSGPPPEYIANEPACRKCGKEFNILFTRPRRCYHCGYSYCHSCTDYQAILPRHASESGAGYDPMPVCSYCIEFLQITASGKGQLKELPLAKLKKYAKAYHIDVSGILEKDELVNKLISIRAPNGCLPPTHENYYRKNSVPNRSGTRPRGLFSRAMDAMAGNDRPSSSSQAHPSQQQTPPYQPRQRTTSGPSAFPRPDLDPRGRQEQPRPQYQTRPAGPPHAHSHSQGAHYPVPPQQPADNPHLNVPPPPARPRAASASPVRQPVEVPSMDALLGMSAEEIARLSIGTLKEVLFRNHVNARLVVEKGELVTKVEMLVQEERAERERKRREEEAERELEEEMRAARVAEERAAREAATGGEAGTGEQHQGNTEENAKAPAPAAVTNEETEAAIPGASAPQDIPKPRLPQPPPQPTLSPKAQAMASRLERTGLCVICQDEEANIAIVDCGHLAMCRACSDLIMNGTKECPLCRTRIVTESRLLRIYRT